MKAYLKIDHVDKTFGGAAVTEVLKEITLSVEAGEYVSIIGHSGCGKSTLLNIVAGLTAATQGGVLLEGREVNEPGPDRAVVFQNHSLLPWLTVYDNVRLGVDKVFSRTKPRAERDAWILHNLDLVQMTHAKDKRPGEISAPDDHPGAGPNDCVAPAARRRVVGGYAMPEIHDRVVAPADIVEPGDQPVAGPNRGRPRQ